MHQCVNLPVDPWSLQPFQDADALRAFYTNYGCDGLEAILCGDTIDPKIQPNMVHGLHLVFYPEWVRLWRNDFAYLDREFGGRKAWQSFYLAACGEDLVDIYRKEIDIACSLGAAYVVFHMGDNALDEFVTLQPCRSNREIVDDSCAFLNEVLRDRKEGPLLLLENMWIGGMDFTDPAMPQRALQQIQYPHTGLMLDTGHLMITNRKLRTQAEGCAYLHHILDINAEILPYIYGVHLHHSLSGAYLDALPGQHVQLTGSYLDRFSQLTQHVRHIDKHQPFTSPAIQSVIERICPQFLVHELAHNTMDEWKTALQAQTICIQERKSNG